MCGLVGVITNFQSGLYLPETDAFVQLLFYDLLRGADATGVTLIHKDGDTHTYKEAVPSSIFCGRDEFRQLMIDARASGKALLGHNRKRTGGKDTDEHAHPFVVDKRYVFFHNGTLKDHEKLAKTELDSQALAEVVTRCEGDKVKLEEVLSKVDGAYACVWYDQVKHTVYMIRNKERPLTIAVMENNSAIAYASEGWMLAGLLRRNNLKIKSISDLNDDVLITINLNETLALQPEALNIKKPLPPITHTTVGAVGGSTASVLEVSEKDCEEVQSCTNKQAQKLLKKFPDEGRPISWEMSDYMETEYLGTYRNIHRRQDFLCWGFNKEWPNVLFRGLFRNVTESELLSASDNPIHSLVSYAQYDNKKKCIVAFCRNLTVVSENAPPYFN